MGPKCYDVQRIVNGENPQNSPFPLGFCHPAGGEPSHGDKQHAQNLVKIARAVREICSPLKGAWSGSRDPFLNFAPKIYLLIDTQEY